MKYVCVFCGSKLGNRPEYQLAAQAMGESLARRGLGLVYGGGSVGLMGTVADTVLAGGGEVIGVIPDFLATKEVTHAGLTKLHIVSSMHERKAMMESLSDAFIALPGGYGTLEEFCEIVTWAQLGLHQKPLGLLNVAGYYDGLLKFLDHVLTEEFINSQLRALILEAAEPAHLLEKIASYQPQRFEPWLESVAEV